LIECFERANLLPVDELDSIDERIHEVVVLAAWEREAFGAEFFFARNLFVDPDPAVHEIRDGVVRALHFVQVPIRVKFLELRLAWHEDAFSGQGLVEVRPLECVGSDTDLVKIRGLLTANTAMCESVKALSDLSGGPYYL